MKHRPHLELLFTFMKKNASFSSFMEKDLQSIKTFTLLIHVSNVLDDFGILMATFWQIFVNKSLRTSTILGLLRTSTL